MIDLFIKYIFHGQDFFKIFIQYQHK